MQPVQKLKTSEAVNRGLYMLRGEGLVIVNDDGLLSKATSLPQTGEIAWNPLSSLGIETSQFEGLERVFVNQR